MRRILLLGHDRSSVDEGAAGDALLTQAVRTKVSTRRPAADLTAISSPLNGLALPARRVTLKRAFVVATLASFVTISLACQVWQATQGSTEALRNIGGSGVVFIAAFVSSIAGFAFSPLAAAALLFLYTDPVRAVEIMVICSIAIQCYSVLMLRREIAWRTLAPFLLGGLPAVPFGVWLLTQVFPDGFSIMLGGLLLSYGTYSALRPTDIRVRGHYMLDIVIGALSGIVGGLTAFPGVITIWCGMRGWTKERQRAVYQPYILTLQIMALVFLSRSTTVRPAWDGLALHISVVLLAAYGGLALFRKLTHRQFMLVVHALLIVSGLFLLARAI